VTAARYRIEERKAGGHEASNPEQGYRTVFTRSGVEVRGTGRNGSDWRLGMKLIGYGYGQHKQTVTFATVKAKDDRIEYERQAPDGGSISEWYVNRVNGLEQGFTIPKAPVKRKAGERLNLWLELSGDLKARLAENGQAILLNRRAAGPGLRYDKLHAFDAKGRELANLVSHGIRAAGGARVNDDDAVGAEVDADVSAGAGNHVEVRPKLDIGMWRTSKPRH